MKTQKLIYMYVHGRLLMLGNFNEEIIPWQSYYIGSVHV